MSLTARIKARLRALKIELHAMALAFRDRRTPWYAKALLVLILAYAASPIDLIPDFIPVLGALDDLVVISAGLWLAIRLIPDAVLAECRQKASEFDAAGGFTAHLKSKLRE
jgi:uncharacterized membrane protein YkvA (DUF1232 family)